MELFAGLDATEAVGAHSRVILLDDNYARLLGIGTTPTPSEEAPAGERASGGQEPPTLEESASSPPVDLPPPAPEEGSHPTPRLMLPPRSTTVVTF